MRATGGSGAAPAVSRVPSAGDRSQPDSRVTLVMGPDEPDERLQRVLSLFRLEFDQPQEMRADVAGKPVYLGLMMSEDRALRLKPQNLLLNLPLAALA
jgi:hypothetical protein